MGPDPRTSIAMYDYIIVGAGSAGSVLANRLSADGSRRVLVLEAGGSDLRFWVQMPIGYGKAFYDARINWKYTSEPVPEQYGDRAYWPRGKVLGGSSAINAMVYVRGHPEDYNDWGRIAPGWSWSDIAPLFQRMEDWDGPESPHRGTQGPLGVHDTSAEVHPINRAFLAGAEQAGIPFNPDYNGARMEGAGLYQITAKGGIRMSTARAYLRPAMKRANLEVITKALATRVLFDGNRATGVAYRHKGREVQARCQGEVILAGGAINSPQLLQLSGIGPGAVLQKAGIEVRVDAPEVGRNLRDHLGVDHVFHARVPTLNQALRPWWGKLWNGLRYVTTRRGPLSLSVNQGGGFWSPREGADRPQFQIYFSPLSFTKAPPGTRPMMNPDPFFGFRLGHNPCKPTSTGHLEIRSPDPTEAPAMFPNYLSTEEDRRLMVEGARLVRRIAATPAMQDVIDHESAPGLECDSDEALLEAARRTAGTVFHQCGTAAMGRVVDPRLRVKGVDGLRVADASIFPDIPTGNTNAPAIMVGEKASDILAEDAP